MHVFPEAMAKVIEVRPDCQGIIVGGPHDLKPNYAHWLNNRLQELGLTSKVVLVGRQHNIPEWMQAMDLRSCVRTRAFRDRSGRSHVARQVSDRHQARRTRRDYPTRGGWPVGAPNDPARLVESILLYLFRARFSARIGLKARQRAMEFNS